MTRRLTHGSYNLCFHSVLVGEASCKVREAASAVSGNVGHLSNVIEHVPTSEEQYQDQANAGPEIAVPNDW